MRFAPRAPASCDASTEQGGGDGDAPWRRVIDEVVEPGSSGGVRRWRTDGGGLRWPGRDLPARREREEAEERLN
jgi:hypothetical protein